MLYRPRSDTSKLTEDIVNDQNSETSLRIEKVQNKRSRHIIVPIIMDEVSLTFKFVRHKHLVNLFTEYISNYFVFTKHLFFKVKFLIE